MSRFILASLLLVSAALSQSPTPISQQEIESALGRAEALYFEARFRESLEAITPIDVALKQEPQRVRDRIRVKLQMALAHVGLNETAEATTRFMEMCALDLKLSQTLVDPTLFATKVITLFDEAKSQHSQMRCTTVCQEVGRVLDSQNSEAFVALLASADADCPCVKAAALDAADLSYQKGLEAYRTNDFAVGLQNFRTALKLSPDHDLAKQYVDLTENKLRLSADRLVLEWRLLFQSRDFARAAMKYRELEASNIEGVATPSLDQIRSEYRTMLSSMHESWKQACQIKSDALAAETRRQATQMLPDAAMGADIVDQMPSSCPVKSCLQVNYALAMSRLKVRVPPELPASFNLFTGRVIVRVKVRIDENGDVTVNGMEGGNPEIYPAVRQAVEQWKFTPARVDDEVRCVETELPLAITRG